MIIKDFLMLAAVTSRSKCYLEKLIGEALFPSFVFLMDVNSKDGLPGQQSSVTVEDLQLTLKENNIPFDTISHASGNEEIIIDRIKVMPQKYIIYSGYGGVILQKNYFNLGKEILHVHGGKLPEYRGSTTVYYQMLSEEHCTATALFLREKIDTGPILHEKNFSFPESSQNIDHGYEPRIRSEVLVETIQEYVRNGFFSESPQAEDGAEDYYIIHPVLKHLAILKCT